MKKRVYEVVNNNPHNNTLTVGKEKLKFGRDNFMYIHDPDKGKEVQRLYDGGDAIVNETEIYVGTEPGHKYTFGPMTSKAAEDFWARYERKKKAQARKERKHARQTNKKLAKVPSPA